MNENLLEMKKQKEEADKRLLKFEYEITLSSAIMYVAVVILIVFSKMQEALQGLVIAILTAFLLFVCCIAIRIEQKAGYYECQKCHHKYVPKYSSVWWAMHFGRTRYMKCPKCGEKSWQKKKIDT